MSRIVLTGASSGIGAATAARLRAGGHRVVGIDLRAEGDDVLACDVRSQESVDGAVAAAVERLGGLDVLVNCAGLGLPQRASLPPGDDAAAVLDVNLMGPWRVTAAALPALRASARGRVVNIASGLAFLAVPLAPAYCMSKRGIVAYSDTLRLEVGHDVDVTTVYPGYVKTPIHDASTEAGFTLDGLVPEEPLDGVADAVVRAAVGLYRRDVATTRQGTVSYFLARRSPRRLLDRLTLLPVRRRARSGKIDGSELASELVAALKR